MGITLDTLGALNALIDTYQPYEPVTLWRGPGSVERTVAHWDKQCSGGSQNRKAIKVDGTFINAKLCSRCATPNRLSLAARNQIAGAYVHWCLQSWKEQGWVTDVPLQFTNRYNRYRAWAGQPPSIDQLLNFLGQWRPTFPDTHIDLIRGLPVWRDRRAYASAGPDTGMIDAAMHMGRVEWMWRRLEADFTVQLCNQFVPHPYVTVSFAAATRQTTVESNSAHLYRLRREVFDLMVETTSMGFDVDAAVYSVQQRMWQTYSSRDSLLPMLPLKTRFNPNDYDTSAQWLVAELQHSFEATRQQFADLWRPAAEAMPTTPNDFLVVDDSTDSDGLGYQLAETGYQQWLIGGKPVFLVPTPLRLGAEINRLNTYDHEWQDAFTPERNKALLSTPQAIDAVQVILDDTPADADDIGSVLDAAIAAAT